MSRRGGVHSFVCGHDGCNERVRYEYFDRAEAAQQQRRYGNGQYRCARHSQPDQVLGLGNLKRVTEIASRETVNDRDGSVTGRYFGYSGFAHGPGFKAFADDFPTGTVLRVTAEVILPTPAPPDGEALSTEQVKR